MSRRWILCGKNDAGAACLEFLVRRGDEVWAVGTAGDGGRDGWQRSFRAAAERLGTTFDQPRRINRPAFVERLAGYRATALLSVQYDQILRPPLFRAIGCPCLNFHFALLPRHRGVAPIAWALLDGDDQAGVTLHHMVPDVDAGDVLAQRAVAIPPAMSARELYDRLSGAAVELFAETYPFPPELLARRLPQDAARASYHKNGDFDFAQRTVDWRRPAAGLQRWLRAMIFPPLQFPETAAAGRRLAVTRVAGELGAPAREVPGTVLKCAEGRLDVAAADRALTVLGLADPGDPAASSETLMGRIAAGDRLG